MSDQLLRPETPQGCDEVTLAARRRMLSMPREPLFLADWDRALMIHYEVEPEQLQPVVPFALDCWDGRAFISVVAFTLSRMRPRLGGKLSEVLFKPIATHEFLNVRTYIRCGEETGIFFMTEWLSNRLSVALGPSVFGLPYRFGHLRYEHDWTSSELAGAVQGAGGEGRFEYRAELESRSFAPCDPDSMDHWLMERYTAFTCPPSLRWRRKKNPTRRFFRVWHQPWQQTRAHVGMKDQSLLSTNWTFFRNARVCGANFSPGVKDVWMGWPHRTTHLASSKTLPDSVA